MQTADILILIAIGLFTGYLGLIYVLFKRLPSVSQSYYEFRDNPEFVAKHGDKFTWLFSAVMIAFAVLIMVAGLEKTSGNPLQFLVFLSTSAICFVGAAPQFKQSLTHGVHYGGAVIGMLCGALMVLFTLSLTPIFILMLLGVAIIGWAGIKNRLYWLELLVFYTASLSILLFDKF